MDHPGAKLALTRYSRTAVTKVPDDTKKLAMITNIHVDAGGLTSLPRIGLFPAATKLLANHNKIEEVREGWAERLEDVDLSDNLLTSFPEIGGTMLMSLNLSQNRLRDIEVPRLLPNLMELNCSIQQEKGSSGSVFGPGFSESLQRHCPRLQALNISATGIVDLRCVEGFSGLKQLVATKNPIQDLEHVIPYLCDDLLYLDVQDCPVAKNRRLFEAVCARCPRLVAFNGKKYSAEQIKFSGDKYLREQRRNAGPGARKKTSE